jgi:hypothetical protein
MLVAPSPSAARSGPQTTEPVAKRKRKREQQGALKINDQKELFEEKL